MKLLVTRPRRFLRDHFFISTLTTVVLAELALILFVEFTDAKPDMNVGIAAFTGIPLLVIGVFQLGRNLQLQRAEFVKEYISKFFTDSDLSENFHHLINNFLNDDFDMIDNIMRSENSNNRLKPVFDPFAYLNEGREVGRRLYHPEWFQGSEEERRLDSLFGYFDVIGYYQHRGLLHIEDIAGTIGFLLTVLREKKVVQRYLDYLEKETQRLAESGKVDLSDSLPPFAYLHRLLDVFDKYNEKTIQTTRQTLRVPPSMFRYHI